ncbi:cytochrome c [Paenibacillus sp. R14(2021)]|uniref:c-type cytochrome n=1 Tax=Paenibacillus sp. R14(2021) TaxID=2859228 RepID=UPI00215762BD|nr:cytochrome c [Paenibacillus sp. R14(2021)]
MSSVSRATPARITRIMLALAPAALLLLGGCGSSSQAVTGSADTPQTFRSNCVSCHGTDLQGRMGAATNLTHVGKRMTKAEITKQIKQGGGVMPPFGSRLSDAEVEKLAGWLSAKK